VFKILYKFLKFCVKLFALGFLIVVVTAITLWSLILYVNLSGYFKIYDDIDKLPSKKYAILLGAAVKPNGEPSDILNDRIDVAVELYKEGKVEKILISGDGWSDENYDEVKTMRAEVLNRGVKLIDILEDEKGTRTINSCRNAKNQHGIDEAIIVTQGFHLPRALYLCTRSGIDAVGYAADKGQYAKILDYQIREIKASFLAFYEINFGDFPEWGYDLLEEVELIVEK